MDQGQIDPVRVINILKQKNADLSVDNAAQQAYIEQLQETLDQLAQRLTALEEEANARQQQESEPQEESQVTPIKKKTAAKS